MLEHRFVTQPFQGSTYLELFAAAYGHSPFTHLDVAVAYATAGGVETLIAELSRLDPARWEATRKRWLIGLDWCRSDPAALDQLAVLPRSLVRIPSGPQVVESPGCTPTIPFHPKAFLLRSLECMAVICGSGNLSRNGLTRGHEVGAAIIAISSNTADDRESRAELGNVGRWFDSVWASAVEYESVKRAYVQRYDEAAHLSVPAPTEDDGVEVDESVPPRSRRRTIPVERLRVVRAARRLWIEAGRLTKNRGPNRPGNQLMMSPMTKVFFGFPAVDLPTDTAIGTIGIRFAGVPRDDCSLRFSNNAMEVLTLPVPGDGGPEAYDDEVLLFERTGGRAFAMSIPTAAEARRSKASSDSIGGTFRMTSGRRFGVF